MEFFKKTTNGNVKEIILFGVKVYKRISSENEKKIYIVGLPILKRVRTKAGISGRILFFKYNKKATNLKNKRFNEQIINRKSVNDLFEELVDYDVISFDIFDTALYRKVSDPDVVFDLMAIEMGWPDFKRYRKSIEAEVRALKKEKAGHREVKLQEIYSLLFERYGLELEWQKRETELELELSIKNNYIYEVYKLLVNAGKTIIFTSDMYLPYDALTRMLYENGYRHYFKLYLSNEYNLRKGDGSLQKRILSDFTGKRVVHVGDNYKADKEESDKAGITGIWNPDSRIEFDLPYHNNIVGSIYRAIINNNINNGLWDRSIHYTHGFRVGGILAMAFCEFISEVVKKEGIDKILFCGRDCYIVKKIYDIIFHDVDTEYAETSRYALMNLSPKLYGEDIFNRFILRYWNENNNTKTVGQILTDMGYAYLIPRLDDYDIEEFSFCKNIKKEKVKKFFLDNVNVVERANETAIKAATEYYKKIIGNGRNVLIVDIGWSGTCINALSYFIKKNISSEINTFGSLMVSSNSKNVINNNLSQRLYSCISSGQKNSNLNDFLFPKGLKKHDDIEKIHMPLEYLFTCTDPSLLGFELKNGKPILIRDKNIPNNPEEIKEIQKGMIDFAISFKQYSSCLKFKLKITPYVAMSPFINAINNEAYCKEVYKNFIYDACTAPYSANRTKKLFKDFFPEALRNNFVTNPEGDTILFVTPELIYTGAPRSLLRVCNVAKKLGFTPIVWSYKDGPFRAEFERNNIKIQIVPESNFDSRKYAKLIKQFKMAYCNTIVTDKAVRVLSKRIPTVWFIREATNIPDFCRNNSKRLHLLKTFKHIYCVSDYAAKAIQNYTNNPIHVIHNCVEDESYYAKQYISGTGKKIKFIQMGTIEYRKGYDVLLAAYNAMPISYREKSEVYFAGGFVNSGMPYCSYLFSKIKNTKGVYYLGLIQGEKNKISTISSMDVVVVASRDESCSLVALEGAMLSKPLIVTENVGANYIIQNNGYVVRTGDVSSLKNAMMSMIDGKTDLYEMGKKSRHSYELNASMNKHINDLSVLFSSLTAADKKFKSKACVNTPATNKGLYTFFCFSYIYKRLFGFINSFKSVSDGGRVIISLTSYPARIGVITKCIKSLLGQTWKNKKIILWLSSNQFINKEKDLPCELLKLIDYNIFEIRWVKDDLKPHKKYFYVMREFPDDPVILVDDDVIYHRNMVSTLMEEYKTHPDCIICHRANLMLFKRNGDFRSYSSWLLDYRLILGTPTYHLLPTGVGGVLYPPKSVPEYAFNKSAIFDNCLLCDDLWLKLMTSLNGYRTVVPVKAKSPKLIKGSQEYALWKKNIDGNNNDDSLKKIISFMKDNCIGTNEMLINLRQDRFC